VVVSLLVVVYKIEKKKGYGGGELVTWAVWVREKGVS
jgi:hypothetical protein